MRYYSNHNREDLEKPFKLGWKREIVERLNSVKKCSDTYYYSPAGKKLRSVPEVIKYLLTIKDESGLGPQNFIFSSHFIYHPPEEFYRGKTLNFNPESILPSLNVTETNPDCMSDIKIKAEEINNDQNYLNHCVKLEKLFLKNNSSSVTSQNFTAFKSSAFKKTLPKSKIKLKCKKKGLKIIISKSIPMKRKYIRQNKIKFKNIKLENNDIDQTEKKSMKPLKSLKKIQPKKIKKIKLDNGMEKGIVREDLCSLNCRNLEGILPGLNCDSCMCSFHPECVNAVGMANFICQSCHEHQIGPAKIFREPNDQPDSISKQKSSVVKQLIEDPSVPNSTSLDNCSNINRILSIPKENILEKLDISKNLNITIDGKLYIIPPNCIIDSNERIQILLQE